MVARKYEALRMRHIFIVSGNSNEVFGGMAKIDFKIGYRDLWVELIKKY